MTKSAVSLIELLVVMVIIGLLGGLVGPGCSIKSMQARLR